ncbi:unnamed protein product [Pieris macdunnoughi]|uniref:Uncharacterized protein n=1 Tax=Pieris macdunnoughi TaxID=345717 RepID=A0A821TNJ9_9NEOP|nr:unnamed protein product [Pieris macdunnoughi]
MVLYSSVDLDTSSIPYHGPKIGHIATSGSEIRNIYCKVCRACELMASIPPSAFSAARIRETQRDMKVSNIKKGGGEPTKFYHTKLMELTPLKYNSKLMNSIWGFYNRYSPHNVKKINDASTFNGELQQSAGNSTNKNDAMLSLPTKLDNVWATISQ